MANFNLIADGETDKFSENGSFRIHMSGAFGGGTLVLEEDVNNNGVFTPVEGTDKTAASDFIVDMLTTSKYRFSLTGATAPDINVTTKGGNVATNR